MRIRRVLGAVLAATLTAGTVGAVTASPASAATSTTITDSSGGQKWMYPSSYRSQPGPPVAGDTIYFSIDVAASDGSSPYGGKVVVQRLLAGTSGWATIATSDYAGYYGSTKALRNASYRALYVPDAGSQWAGTTSATKGLAVQRKITVSNKGTRRVVLAGRVAPKYSGKVVILKKNGKRYKTWRKVKVRKSKFRVILPAPRRGRFYWNVKIAAGKGFAASQTGKFYTYKRY